MDDASLMAELRERRLTLATAESLTGGGLGLQLTAVPRSSEVYLGGVVAYATRIKELLLGVSPELVATHGVVSAACAEAMARGARERLGADLAISTTGVAGPEPQEDQPVGLVFVGLSGAALTSSRELRLSGGREEVRRNACEAALRLAASHWRTAHGGDFPGGR